MRQSTRCLTVVALLTALGSAAVAAELSTRFGPLKIGGRFGNELSFKGRRLIQAHNALSPVETFRIGKTDVVLVQETGGTACPALYYYVTVSASGAKATKAFGTCGEHTSVTRKGDTILVSMPGHQGPLEPAAAREEAAREKHVFAFRAGVVREQGRRGK